MAFQKDMTAFQMHQSMHQLSIAIHPDTDSGSHGNINRRFAAFCSSPDYFSEDRPIYIRIKYFDYYYAPDIVLKFDLDDLFYYSSHKIMKRGDRFFVADYGMQTGIASRYGIKSYAVCGRDYRFVNGDSLDFRYENIEIKNRFHGVKQLIGRKTGSYQAKIHVNGYFVIGYYNTETEAAIAYNKAIDILKKAGVKKQYVPNYLESISPALYADLYNTISISKTILNYRP